MRVRAGRRTCLEQKQPVEARLSCGAGLTGRYFGGQATQQEQRFDARGEDPDQFAGWFEQSMTLFHTCDHLAGCAGSCLETIEVIDPFFQSVFAQQQIMARGFVRSELTFSLVLTAEMLTDLPLHGKGFAQKRCHYLSDGAIGGSSSAC